jgi:hypothetical protein
MKHIIVIDDTGSPGNFNESKFLKENRKTLVGVFIHSSARVYLELKINKIILPLNTEFGITEIHLTDLVNRKNEYSDVPQEYLLTIIKYLSEFFLSIQLPYIVQTCNVETFIENNIALKEKLENFDFKKGEDQALFLLICRIKQFMDKHFPNEEVEIVMDEGRKRNRQVEEFKILKGIAIDSSIKYFSSKEFLLLQIADFFAYSLNRTQMTLIKENKSESDKILFEYLNTLLTKQFSIGTTLIEGNIENFSKDIYDDIQVMQRNMLQR